MEAKIPKVMKDITVIKHPAYDDKYILTYFSLKGKLTSIIVSREEKDRILDKEIKHVMTKEEAKIAKEDKVKARDERKEKRLKKELERVERDRKKKKIVKSKEEEKTKGRTVTIMLNLWGDADELEEFDDDDNDEGYAKQVFNVNHKRKRLRRVMKWGNNIIRLIKTIDLQVTTRIANQLTAGERIDVHTNEFQDFRQLLDGSPDLEDFNQLMDDLASTLVMVEIVSIGVVVKRNKIGNWRNRKARDDDNKYIMSDYVNYTINPKAKSLSDFLLSEFSDEYINNNFKKYSCGPTIIIDTFKVWFDKGTKGKERKKKLTYEFLHKFFHPKDNEVPDEQVETLDTLRTFFVKYSLTWKVYDQYMTLLPCSYSPMEEHSKTSRGSLHCIYLNGHLYKLNHDLNRLNHLKQSDEKVINDAHYHIGDTSVKQYYIESIDELTKLDYSDPKQKVINVAYNGELKDLLFYLIYTIKYHPKIMQGSLGTILKIVMKFNTTIVFISHVDYSPDNIEMEMTGEENFREYSSLSQNLYSNLINEKNLSKYPENLLNTLLLTMPKALCGKLDERKDIDAEVGSSDWSKDYLARLLQIKGLPIAKEFDDFQPYDGDDFKEECIYLVQLKVPYQQLTKGMKILLTTMYILSINICQVAGLTLQKYYDKMKKYCDVIAVLQFSTYRKNTCLKDVEKIFKSNILTVEQKKFIPCKITGQMEKLKNTKRTSKIFKDIDEADKYAEEHGGDIKQIHFIDPDELQTYHDKKKNYNYGNALDHDIDGNVEDNSDIPQYPKIKHQIYSVICKSEKVLCDGFLPIKIFIYLYNRLAMYELYEQLRKKYHVFAIKTDCLFYELDDDEIKTYYEECIIDKKRKKQDIYGTIGMISKSLKDNAPEYDFNFKETKSTITIKNIGEVNKLEIQDEFNQEEITEVLLKKDRVLISGLCPGTGKTTLLKKFSRHNSISRNRHWKTKFIAPTNKLCSGFRKQGYDCDTLYKLTGTILKDGKEKAGKALDISKYKIIVFDEIFFYPTRSLFKVFKFMKTHPDILFYATGDVNQNAPIDHISSNSKMYYKRIVNIMFPNQIELKINKRMKGKEDQDIAMKIREDLFTNHMSEIDVTYKYFKDQIIHKRKHFPRNDNDTYISYRNMTRDKLNNYLQRRYFQEHEEHDVLEINGLKYYVGLELVCRNRTKLRGGILQVNQSYIIKEINKEKKTIIMNDISYNGDLTISFKLLKKLSLPFCWTCHSFQGETADGKVIITDIDYKYVSPEWYWTAITRAKSFSDVLFYIPEPDNINIAKIRRKIEAHRKEDHNKGRLYADSDYVTPYWVLEQMDKQNAKCIRCDTSIDINYEPNSLYQFSINRLNNTKAHTTDNVELICLSCNHSYKG